VADIQNAQSDDLTVREQQNKEVSDILTASGSALADTIIDETVLQTPDSYESAAELLSRLEDQLNEANDYLDSIDDAAWMIRTRDDLTGYNSYSSNVGKVSALAKIFPVFFFVVALLVALTTMSRLIEEKRLQIGTLKALGYSNGQIIFEYMLFSISASVLGCILGFGVGFRIFPYAINSAYSMMYTLPAISTPIRWDIVAWVAPVTIVSILLATLWSCWSEFRSMPAILMLPKSPAPGKRIWLEHIGFIWRRMSFTHKVTARNLFRYKKRFIMTIIGVAGCSALLLTGFGIKDSVNDIIDKQYRQIDKYDLIFAMDEEDSLTNDESLNQTINDKDIISEYLSVSQETGKVYYGKEKQEINIFVPQDTEKFADFTTLRTRSGHDSIMLSDDSIVLTEKLCEEMGINIGDSVTLEDSEGHQSTVMVSAITENYVSSYAYLTPETYTACFSSEPEYTNLLCKLTAGENADSDTILELANEATSKIMASSHILYGRSVASLKDTFSDSIQSINGVIYVLIIAAGLLCIVVLYNLINVNICERRKELATLRVLGFYKSETQNYIFRETNILSFLGALVGLVLGIWLHSVVVKTIEVNHIMFGREIKPLSYIIALAISVVFTLLVDLIMKRPINKTDMVEAMKAND
jgi:putative ABC transport system permease protein